MMMYKLLIASSAVAGSALRLASDDIAPDVAASATDGETKLDEVDIAVPPGGESDLPPSSPVAEGDDEGTFLQQNFNVKRNFWRHSFINPSMFV